MLLGGRTADLLGRRRVFLVGLLVFTAASLASGLAWPPHALIVSRAAQGFGAALLLPSALAIITTTYAGAQRAHTLPIGGAMSVAASRPPNRKITDQPSEVLTHARIVSPPPMGTARGVSVIHSYVELLTDTELLERSSVSPEAFRDIFRRHFAAVHRYVQGQAGRGAADDLTAEVFVVAFERRGRYRPLCDSARPWLLGIATNLLRERRRSTGRLAGIVARLSTRGAEDEDSSDRTDERLDARDARDEIASALSRLRAHERDVLLLYALGDLTYAEIAVALDIPTGTVRSRLSRARAVLQRTLGDVAHLTQPIEDGSEQ